MGNPAMVKRKKTEKRRKKYEQRLGPGVYRPKEDRLQFNAEVEKAAAAAEIESKASLAKKAQVKKDKKAKKSAPPAEAPATK